MKKFFLIAFFYCIAASANAANSTLITTDFSGKNFDLAAQKGKIVIVNFWAKWCSDCRKEMPVLNDLYKKYQARGLEIIGVSIDPKKQREEVEAIAKKFCYPNSIISDAQKNDFDHPKSLPTNYIIFEGKIIKILDDSKLEAKDFEEVILPLFKMNLTR